MEQQQGQRVFTPADFPRLLEILDAPDAIVVTPGGRNNTKTTYQKRFTDGTVMVAEWALETSSRKTPRLVFKNAWVKVSPAGVKSNTTPVYTPGRQWNHAFSHGQIDPDSISKVVDENSEPLMAHHDIPTESDRSEGLHHLGMSSKTVEPASNAQFLAMSRKVPEMIEGALDDPMDDSIRDAYEAAHLTPAAHDYRMPAEHLRLARAPAAELRKLGLLWRAVAAQKGAFTLGPLTDAQKSAQKLDDVLRAYNLPLLFTQTTPGRDATVIYLEPPTDVPEEFQAPRHTFEIEAKGPGKFSVNSLMGAGAHATRLYQAIYTWAHNNGHQIVPDTGYTKDGAFRRVSHMLSSALRHGTMQHFMPHSTQVPALAGLRLTPESFTEDVGLLAAVEADMTLARAPFLGDIWEKHDLHRALHDSSSAATRRIVAGMQETKSRLNQENRRASLRVGKSTAQRAFLAHHRLLGEAHRQSLGVAGREPAQGRERKSLLTKDVLYMSTRAPEDGKTPEMRQIEAQARANGTWLKAPNGQPTKLTERQWLHVRTAKFKQWFGDWEKFANGKDGNGVWNDASGEVSKIVDENGEPMVVYHGAPRGGALPSFQIKRENLGMVTERAKTPNLTEL